MIRFCKYIFLSFLVFLLVSGCSSDNSRYIVDEPVTLSIQVTPSNIKVPKFTAGEFTAVAFYSDGTYKDVSTEVTWTSSNISSVDFNTSVLNHAEAINPGISYISARLNEVESNQAKVEVTNVSLDRLEVSPSVEQVAKGSEVKYKAIGYFSDGSHYNLTLFSKFSSSNTGVATIKSYSLFKSGLASTLSVGSSNISASFAGVTSNIASLTVTAATVTRIQVTPANIVVPKKTQDYYTAIAYYSDNTSRDITSQATWFSSNPSVVSIISVEAGTALTGLATAVSNGTSNITASLDGVISNTAVVRVTGKTMTSIHLVPEYTTIIAIGQHKTYKVWAYYDDSTTKDVTLSSTLSIENTDIATIDNIGSTKGRVTGISVGSTLVKASFEGLNDTAPLQVMAAVINSLQITPASLSMRTGSEDVFTALAFYSDGRSEDVSHKATWTSSDTTKVSISSSEDEGGLVHALSAGMSNIEAQYNGKTSNIAVVTVTGKAITSIHLTPEYTTTIAVGQHKTYKVWAYYDDGSTKDITTVTTLSTDDTSIATIENIGEYKGRVMGISVGSTLVRANYEGQTDTAPLTITSAVMTSIQVSPGAVDVPVETEDRFIAVAFFSDGTHKDISSSAQWKSDNTAVVSIVPSGSEGGLAHAQTTGSANISASSKGVNSNLVLVNVTGPTLSNIQISPNNQSVALGTYTPYTVFAVYSNLTQKDITDLVQIQSADTSMVTFDTDNIANAVGVGSTSMSTVYKGLVSETEFIHVTASTVSSIALTPAPTVEVPLGTQDSFTAIATFSDTSTQDISFQATWVSDDTNVVGIVPSGSTGGLASALGAGTANITANFGGITSPATAVTVAAKNIKNIQITPNNTTVILGSFTQYTVAVVYDDLTVKDVTAFTQIKTLSSGVAIFDTNNIAQAIGVGAVELTTQYQGVVSEREFIYVNP